MKWFKHETNASRSQSLALLRAVCGLEGYGFYWGVLEVLAESCEEIDESGEVSVSLPTKIWCGTLNLTPQKFKKLLETCASFGLFSVSLSDISGKKVIRIGSKDIASRADEYTSRKASRKKQDIGLSGHYRDIIGTLSAQNRIEEKTIEESRREENREEDIKEYHVSNETCEDVPSSTCPDSEKDILLEATESNSTGFIDLETVSSSKRKIDSDGNDRNRNGSDGDAEATGDEDENLVDCEKDNERIRCPHKDIVALYHEILPELRQVRSWNATREKRLRARWREDKCRQSLSWWREYFERVRASSFLVGKKTDWSADFDWLIRPTNMAKVLEGKYDDSPPNGASKTNVEALFRDLVSSWPADRIGDVQAAKKTFCSFFSDVGEVGMDEGNRRLRNLEAWALIVLEREPKYVPRLDRWLSGLDVSIPPPESKPAQYEWVPVEDGELEAVAP